MIRTLLVLGLTLALVGCIPVPVVTPPMKITLGGGPALGDLTDDPAGEQDGVEPVFGFSAGLHPLQYFQLDDPTPVMDAGVGFIFEDSTSSVGASPLIGGYLEGAYAVWHAGNREDGQVRFYVVGEAQILQNSGPSGANGFGGSFGVGIEFVQFVVEGIGTVEATTDSSGDVDLTSYLGVAIGEGGIGAEMTMNVRQVGEQQYNALLFNLILRAPATAGILLVPLYGND